MPSSIFNVFVKSPLHGLQEHMETVYRCAQELLPFLDAILEEDWKKVELLQHRIADLEGQADVLKKQLRLNLPKSLFLPVPRSDVLEVLAMQDRIANKAKDIAGIILGRKMTIPQAIAPDFLALMKRSIDAAKQAHKAIQELDELLETGFRGSEVALVEEMIVELGNIEHDTDEIQIKVRRQLYEQEKDLPPIDVMFLYKVIEWTGDLADCSQRVGNCLELMLAR